MNALLGTLIFTAVSIEQPSGELFHALPLSGHWQRAMRVEQAEALNGDDSRLDETDPVALLIQFEMEWMESGRTSASNVPDLKIVDVYVSEQMLPYVGRLLHLSDSKQEVLKLRHGEYWTTLVELDREGIRKAEEAGRAEFRRLAQQELEEKGYVESMRNPDEQVLAEMARHAARAHMETVRHRLHADELLRVFLDDVMHLVEPDHADRLIFVERFIRRWTWATARNSGTQDFRAGIDVFSLVAAAAMPGAELESLSNDGNLSDSICSVLERYEIEQDVLRLNYIQRARQPLDTTVDIRILPGSPSEKRQSNRWSRQYDVTRAAVDRIAHVARDLISEEASERWMARYLAEFCPMATARRAPDVLVARLENILGTVEEHQQIRIDAIYERYTVARAQLLETLIQRGVAAMKRHGSVHGVQEEHLQYARSQLAEQRLIQRTLDEIRAALTIEQAPRFQQWMDSLPAYSPELLRPAMTSTVLQALREQGEIE